MRKIVISGINLFSGGTLTIFRQMIRSFLDLGLNKQYELVCFVHQKSLFEEFKDRVSLYEFPDSKDSYRRRLYYEHNYFREYSEKNDVYVWISAQDITPTVKADKLCTYCHNPMMFYPVDVQELKYAKKLALFSLFYKYVYKYNIRKNTYVIVQQNWIRERFSKAFKIDNILVARPDLKNEVIQNRKKTDNVMRFIFASQATFFKNFEVICEATKKLSEMGVDNFEVLLTIDGLENRYSKDIKAKYQGVKQIKWIGFQNRDNLFNLYATSDCMIFPSKLETWGLPISEFKGTNKPIILADLPYAHETIGTYDYVCFFNQNDSTQLANIMHKVILKEDIFKKTVAKENKNLSVNNWEQFWQFIV